MKAVLVKTQLQIEKKSRHPRQAVAWEIRWPQMLLLEDGRLQKTAKSVDVRSRRPRKEVGAPDDL